MADVTLSPVTPVTNGAIVTSSNPLPVTLVGGIVATTITVGTTLVASGTASGILWNKAGVLASGAATTDDTGNIAVAGTTTLRAPSDGILTLTNAANNAFTRLQLGGTTSSFPAIKRNGTAIDIRLADDSTYGPLNSGAIIAHASNITANAFASTTGDATVQAYVYTGTGTGTVILYNAGFTAGTLLDFNTNGTLKFRNTANNADAAITALSLATGAPSGGASGVWKFGIRVAAVSALDTTQYLQVDVGGTLYKVALIS